MFVDPAATSFSNEKMKIRILGLDPGSRVTGFGIVEFDGGAVSYLRHGAFNLFSENPDFTQRLALLGQELRKILIEYRPQHVAIERVFLGRNADSAFKLGHARGVAVYESTLMGCEFHEYASREVKKGVTGNGAAEKAEVMAVVHRLLKVPKGTGFEKSYDASDALALAYFHCQKLQLQNLIRRSVQI